MRNIFILAAAGLVGFTTCASAESLDFGQLRDEQLRDHAEDLFGVAGPLKAASTASVSADTAEANPLAMLRLARGLHARVVSSRVGLGANIDMMALWPDDTHPTHLIACNEQGATQPGVQRIDLATGDVATLLNGTVSCDPVHRTAWGTIVVAEEAGSSGSMLEIMDPLHTDNVSYNRATGEITGDDAAHVALRRAVGHLSFEGVALLANGVMYYSDENRPSKGTPGGAYFKFIPSMPWNGAAPIATLDDSPLAAGRVYGLRLGKRSDSDYGHGTNTGSGNWIEVEDAVDADLRAATAALKLTGYYRPEDMDIDGKSLADGMVRICANNTGNESNDQSWGESICITDGSPQDALANSATPQVQYFVIGTRDFSMMDNIAYQPHRGNWMVHEDRDSVEMTGPGYPFNDSIWLCLEDGADVDTLSDGCVRVATLNDLHAESTGGLFNAKGDHYYFSIQHNITGHGTIVEVTGWK